VEFDLRPNVTFHDGSPVDAETVAAALKTALPQYMGPAFSEITHIAAASATRIEIGFIHPSPLLLEGLEATIQKPGPIGTGPFVPVGQTAPNEMRANPTYSFGRPAIDRIVVNPYHNVRSAWADMLRDRIDMLYEVGTDALDSLTSSKTVSVFTYVRHYQYVLVFNTRSGVLAPKEIRRALNEAVDRAVFVKEAFDGHAVPSSGPVWPSNWAVSLDFSGPSYNPRHAASTLAKRKPRLRFTCLVRPGLERVTLALKRQLEEAGVDVTIEEAPLNSIFQSMGQGTFEAVLMELLSGPNLFRPYEIWHSKGSANPGGFGSTQLDVAFDQILSTTDDAGYRAAVSGLQAMTIDDPPGIFLAWPERARAVSRRFDVAAEPNRDILTTLRLWRPTNALEYANRN